MTIRRQGQVTVLRRFPIGTSLSATLCSAGLFISFCCAAARETPAKQSGSSEESSQTPMRVSTRLVQVNVIVNDQHGNPITGLRKEDFVLLDNKTPEEIQFLSAETNLPTAQPSSPAPPDTYSNHIPENAAVPASVTLILLDALNTEFADQALTRKQVSRFLEQLQPQDRVALYWLSNKLYVLNDFTSDVASLREALGRSKRGTKRDLRESNVDYLNPANPNPSLPQGVPAGQTSSREAFRSAFDQRVANEAIRHAIDDSRVTYTLGFYPTAAKWDGTFHTIKVKVKTPGAEVRARTGYLALPDSASAPPKSVQALISQTAISQLHATAIGLRVHLQPASSTGEQALNVDLHLDLHDIHMEQNNGFWTSTLQTAFLQLNQRGEIIQGLDETLQLTLPPLAYEQALKDGLRNTRPVRILPSAAQLCIVLRDPSSGNLGSLSIALAKYLPGPATPVGSH